MRVSAGQLRSGGLGLVVSIHLAGHEALDIAVKTVDASVHRLESHIHRVEPSVHCVETRVHLVSQTIDLCVHFTP